MPTACCRLRSILRICSGLCSAEEITQVIKSFFAHAPEKQFLFKRVAASIQVSLIHLWFHRFHRLTWELVVILTKTSLTGRNKPASHPVRHRPSACGRPRFSCLAVCPLSPLHVPKPSHPCFSNFVSRSLDLSCPSDVHLSNWSLPIKILTFSALPPARPPVLL